MIRSFLVLDRDLKEFWLPPFSGSILPHLSLPRKVPELYATAHRYGNRGGRVSRREGGAGGGQIFKKRERKERTREVTVRPEIMCDRSKTVSG